VAIVTGAASGIGRAVCVRLAGEGAQVLGHDINGEGLARTADLVGAAGGQMRVRRGDCSNRDECRATVEECVDGFGRLDVLGNVAGIARAEHVVEVTEEAYRQMMAVNMDAYFFFCQAAIPHLLGTGGNIVNIASNAGLMGQAYTVAYCMSKGAVVQLTRSLALEFIRTPLRVNAIAPGGTETSLTKGFHVPPDVDFDLMARYTGFRGMGSAEEIAALFAYLASDEAAGVHGAIVSSDRGVTAG
jgi:NAD(P)-dependent dehydrogenase (short-subunit alcohol dehydrogenase family)